jgi:two-component system cell cycle response regulator DivK
MKVMIIEDNPTNMKFAADLLKLAGCEVIEATDADVGIKMAKKILPRCILMDLQLPGIDGFEAVKILKSAEETKEIQVIAMTALAMKGDKERILAAGFDGYIAKPVRYKELLGMLQSYMTK